MLKYETNIYERELQFEQTIHTDAGSWFEYLFDPQEYKFLPSQASSIQQFIEDLIKESRIIYGGSLDNIWCSHFIIVFQTMDYSVELQSRECEYSENDNLLDFEKLYDDLLKLIAFSDSQNEQKFIDSRSVSSSDDEFESAEYYLSSDLENDSQISDGDYSNDENMASCGSDFLEEDTETISKLMLQRNIKYLSRKIENGISSGYGSSFQSTPPSPDFGPTRKD